MTVRVVTDSTSDLPPEVARELDIAVVPLYVRFGEQVYRDGVDIKDDEFYRRLVVSPVHPSTSQPTPADFAGVYNKVAKDADGIVSVHISRKMSGTCDSALRGREMLSSPCPVEVIDSESVSIGAGLVAIAAARVAKTGANLQTVLNEARQAVEQTHICGLLDTLKYLHRGGRIGKAKALLGSLLNVKPILAMRDGELVPAGLARTRNRGLDKLTDFVKEALNIQEIGLVYSTSAAEAVSLRERLGSFFSSERIHISRLGPALGVHGGPGTLLLALREKANSLKKISLPSQSGMKPVRD
ncbi:MAG: DegV family protein [Dehalococcoidales bacterium]|nr:DegV family protein [Dehalococcoidales bacterium]